MDAGTETTQTSENGHHPPLTVEKDAAYRVPVESAELLRADAGDVQATSVTMDRSGAEQITAERVAMDRSGAKTLTAKSAQLDQSGVLRLDTEHLVLHDSAAVAVSSRETRVVGGRIVLLKSGQTTVEGDLRPLVHIGPACDHVRPVFTGKSAMQFGAVCAFVLLIGGRLLGRMFGRG